MSRFINAAILVDTSSSMRNLIHKAREELQRQVNEFRSTTQPGRVTIFTFDTSGPFEKVGCLFSESITVPYLDAQGNTSLYKSIADTCEILYRRAPSDKFTENVFVLNVITDGENNQPSSPEDRQVIPKLMKKDNWTFGITGPDQYRFAVARDLGISEEMILPWDGVTEASYLQTQAVTRSSFTTYVSEIEKGKKKVEKFYASVKKDLIELPLPPFNVRQLKVTSDDRIDRFVESKTKKPYVAGSAYYELIKEETVQSNKGIIAQHKISGVLRHVTDRSFLGLRNGEDAKVTPGNFGDWRIFVQSKAQNRNLPARSRVLVVK